MREPIAESCHTLNKWLFVYHHNFIMEKIADEAHAEFKKQYRIGPPRQVVFDLAMNGSKSECVPVVMMGNPVTYEELKIVFNKIKNINGKV